MPKKAIRLTHAQYEVVEWALDSMEDFWDEDNIEDADPEGIVPLPVVLPTLNNKALTVDISDVHYEVLDDLRYRIVEQMGAMRVEEFSWGEGNGQNVAGDNAWSRILAAHRGE
jgi:hypothetical protein